MQDAVISELVSLGGSIKLMGYPDDGYYRHVVDDPGAEHDVLGIMTLLIEPGWKIVDVGANIGLETISAARLTGPKGRVRSFEPSPSNYELLLKNLELNGVEDIVRPFKYGLSDKAAEFHLLFNAGNRGGAFIGEGASEQYTVDEVIKTKVLDDLTGEPAAACDLVKVDIEGHEPNFLRGAEKFLAKHKPACIIEANYWCLDALNDTTMPAFLKQLYAIFPFVYAFDNTQIVNVREREMYFMHENMVQRRLQNLYCGFDRKQATELALRYERYLRSDRSYVSQLEEQVRELRQVAAELEDIKRSRSHRLAVRVNKAIGR